MPPTNVKGGNYKCYYSTNSEVSYGSIRPLAAILRQKGIFKKVTLAKINVFKGNFSKNNQGVNVHPCNSFWEQMSSHANFHGGGGEDGSRCPGDICPEITHIIKFDTNKIVCS